LTLKNNCVFANKQRSYEKLNTPTINKPKMLTSLANSLYAFIDFNFSMLPASDTCLGEPIYYDFSAAGELFNVLFYMFPILILLL
jgi:hypothetical protein